MFHSELRSNINNYFSSLKIDQYPAAVISVKITVDGRDSGLLTRVTAVIYGCSPGSGLCAGTSQTRCLGDRTTLASVCQDFGIFSFININNNNNNNLLRKHSSHKKKKYQDSALPAFTSRAWETQSRKENHTRRKRCPVIQR